jgi:hypothetical protein
MFHITSNKQMKIKISSEKEIFYQLKTLHCTKLEMKSLRLILVRISRLVIEVNVIIRLV